MEPFMLMEVRVNCAFLCLSQLKSYHRLFFINLKSIIYCSRNKRQTDIFPRSPLSTKTLSFSGSITLLNLQKWSIFYECLKRKKVAGAGIKIDLYHGVPVLRHLGCTVLRSSAWYSATSSTDVNAAVNIQLLFRLSLKFSSQSLTIRASGRCLVEVIWETRKNPSVQGHHRAEPNWTGILWGNSMWSVIEGSILCQGGVWEEKELGSHRMFGHFSFWLIYLLLF